MRGWITYYGAFIAPSCLPSHGASTSTSSGGPCKTSNDFVAGLYGLGLGRGWLLSVGTDRPSLPIGVLSPAPNVCLWEPGEGRPSRRVLREPGVRFPPTTHRAAALHWM